MGLLVQSSRRVSESNNYASSVQSQIKSQRGVGRFCFRAFAEYAPGCSHSFLSFNDFYFYFYYRYYYFYHHLHFYIFYFYLNYHYYHYYHYLRSLLTRTNRFYPLEVHFNETGKYRGSG